MEMGDGCWEELEPGTGLGSGRGWLAVAQLARGPWLHATPAQFKACRIPPGALLHTLSLEDRSTLAFPV